MEPIEILGFVAGAFVLFSFVLKGELKIRMANSFGAGLFAIYGLLIDAWAIWIINTILMLVQIYYLFKRDDTPHETLPTPAENAPETPQTCLEIDQNMHQNDQKTHQNTPKMQQKSVKNAQKQPENTSQNGPKT